MSATRATHPKPFVADAAVFRTEGLYTGRFRRFKAGRSARYKGGMPRVSLILPTYEETDFASSVERLSAAVAALATRTVTSDGPKRERSEIILVDDSKPALRAAMTEWSAVFSKDLAHAEVRVLEGPHRGKGAAVRVGALASRGDVVFVMDADLPIPLERIVDFTDRVENGGADVVIGERPMTRNAGDPVRFVLSRGLFAIQWLVVFQQSLFTDTQCGFKAFRGDVLRRMAAQQIVEGGMYDIEYLYMATRLGLRIERVPVVPNPESRPSKINVKRAMLRDPRDLLRVKWRGLTKGYKP
jgi:glycosyltransferase involved in cell wall biosynthesis